MRLAGLRSPTLIGRSSAYGPVQARPGMAWQVWLRRGKASLWHGAAGQCSSRLRWSWPGLSGHGVAGRVLARLDRASLLSRLGGTRRGKVRQVPAGHVLAWLPSVARQGSARRCGSWLGSARQGKASLASARLGLARPGASWRGTAGLGLARLGMSPLLAARPVPAWRGRTWHGMASLTIPGLGKAPLCSGRVKSRLGTACLGEAGRGSARRGAAEQGSAPLGAVRHDAARQGVSRHGKTRHGEARLGSPISGRVMAGRGTARQGTARLPFEVPA